MLNKIAFIGGIHGVGKSTICRNVCKETGLIYLSASDLLKWNEIQKDRIDKTVIDIGYTQDRLIQGLYLAVKQGHKYLLDGHFTLLNERQNVSRIPREIFEEINPFSLNLIVDCVTKIKSRLEERDNKFYDVELLNALQNEEIFYAKELSELLNIKLNIARPEDVSSIINSLNQSL